MEWEGGLTFPEHRSSLYLYTGAAVGSAIGGGAFPLPIDPQALKLITVSTATTVIRALFIRRSFSSS
jgi:hypothetical protein